MAGKEEAVQGLNILCLDGGGARGLSSLVVLREIMHRINSKSEQGVGLLEPHQHFDVIAGTGTGGVSACMLGRLRISIDKVIEEYAKMMESIFSEKKLSGPTMYKGTKLHESLRTMIRDATENEGEMMIEDETKQRCKTAVFAMARHNLNASIPVMFRSYKVSANPGPNCTIAQALYATMAHPDLFKGIDIPDASVPQSFIGGEIGCSNPLAHVLSEVNRIYPSHRVACIISIGAGHAHTIQLPSTSRLRLLLRTQDVAAMKGMATDSERVAEEMAERFQDTTGVYFRFNVDQGVQDMKDGSWERLGETMEHTKAYLQKNETNQRIENAVHASMEKQVALATKQTGKRCKPTRCIYTALKPRHTTTAGRISGVPDTQAEMGQQAPKLKRCPAPTPVYTGRADENIQLATCITGSKNERRVGVVYGLGGVGKTQLVLNMIERTRDQWDYIIFVDASSNATIEGDLKNFAKAKGIGNIYEDTIRWLESCRERWLVVYDNADTPSTNIRQYIPPGQHGSVLITTRLPDLASLAKGPDSVFHLSSMNSTDGLALFTKTARIEDQCLPGEDMDAAQELLKDFGYLALAIVHAGAYIAHSPAMSFTQYRNLFLTQRQRMLEQYNELPTSAKLDDYGKTVYTTWRMCYDQLKPESRTMLWLISYLHYTHISGDIFSRAAQGMVSHYDPLPLNVLESQARTHVKQFLSTFIGPDESWDIVKFINVMADLRLYSLVDYDRMNAAYSIHVLVQDWARTVTPQTPQLAIECSATLVALSIHWNNDTGSLAHHRQLEPHVTSLLRHNPGLGVNYTYRLKEVYRCTGQWGPQAKLELQIVKAFQQEFGLENHWTLRSMNDLAVLYRSLGRSTEADTLEVQVVDISKRVLGEEHTDTLTAISNLSCTYSRLGRLDEAEKMQAQVLSARRRLSGEEHAATLMSKAHLATIYGQLNRWDEAEQLMLQVLEAWHESTHTSVDGMKQWHY
ncbi:unnamed protein product [Rhizoctonia solani]|nr:unnamed protein product [Rhizoctonia solani]